MKRTICLLILFLANHASAQLKVEQLTNDSLINVFICQQTGKKFLNVHFVTGKELKERRVIAESSTIDSMEKVQSVVTDFNNDDRQDLIVSYAVRVPEQKYFDKFYITAFVSNASGKYEVKELWKQYEWLLGGIAKMLTDRKHLVLTRLEYEFREEKLRYDTLKYFQGEFISVSNPCRKSFDSIQYYTSSNWVASSYRYSYLTVFANRVIRKEDFEMDNKRIYQCALKQEVFDSLYNLICEINLWELKDRYEMQFIRDAGTSHLVINYLDSVKKINDYGHWGNFGLGALYKMLWRINREAEWILLSESKSDNYRLKRMPGKN